MAVDASLLRDAALLAAIVGTQAYNVWQHRQHAERLTVIAGRRRPRAVPAASTPAPHPGWVPERPARTLQIGTTSDGTTSAVT